MVSPLWVSRAPNPAAPSHKLADGLLLCARHLDAVNCLDRCFASDGLSIYRISSASRNVGQMDIG